ncbi:MAG: polysaccharide biosynthesis C-terminal domain-containing protein [Clostridia bacterium]|nr:polysaccharide biosynthesis C-terminal domain-containing protein [Clostridia bacterium]
MTQQPSKVYKNLAKDTALFALSSFGSKILVFLLTPLYTYVLTTTEYGIADLINTTIHFIYPVLTLAIADATLRYALDKSVSKTHVLNNSMLFTLLASLILVLFYPLIGTLSNTLNEYWIIFILNFTLFNIQNCFSNFLKGIGKTALFAIQGILHTISLIICNILFLLVFKTGLYGYLISTVIGHIIPILLMFFAGKIYKHWRPLDIDKQLMKDMLKYSIPMIPTLLAWAINTSIDKYMIIYFVGLAESGVYSVAHKIPTILTTVLSIFTQAWQLSAISNCGDKNESGLYTSIYNKLDVISVLGCMTIIGSAQLMSSILFAKNFYVAWKCVPMLIISAMFSSHAGFLAAAFRAYKKTSGLFLSVIAGSIVNIALNLILIPAFGIIGAAIGTATGFFVLWLTRIVMIKQIVDIKINWLKTALTYMLMIFSAYVISFEVKFSYGIFAIAFLTIIILNFNTLKYSVSSVLEVLMKKFKLSK